MSLLSLLSLYSLKPYPCPTKLIAPSTLNSSFFFLSFPHFFTIFA